MHLRCFRLLIFAGLEFEEVQSQEVQGTPRKCICTYDTQIRTVN